MMSRGGALRQASREKMLDADAAVQVAEKAAVVTEVWERERKKEGGLRCVQGPSRLEAMLWVRQTGLGRSSAFWRARQRH